MTDYLGTDHVPLPPDWPAEDPVTQHPPPTLYANLRCWSGPELLAEEFPPLRWIVPDLIPAGLSLLVGAPKVGKSWAALDVALAVAAGGKALGGIAVEAGGVLYLALEDGPRRVADRMRLLLGSDGPSARFHAFTTGPAVSTRRGPPGSGAPTVPTFASSSSTRWPECYHREAGAATATTRTRPR